MRTVFSRVFGMACFFVAASAFCGSAGASPAPKASSETVASVRARAHAEIAARDAEIARLGQQVADQEARLTRANALLTQKDAVIAKLQAQAPSPALTHGAATDLPPAPPGKRWDSEFTFTGERQGGAGPDMYYWSPADLKQVHKASRPMPEGMTAEDYARGFEFNLSGTRYSRKAHRGKCLPRGRPSGLLAGRADCEESGSLDQIRSSSADPYRRSRT